MRVSCSSEGGDSPQYSWTLDGHTLTDAQLLSGNNESNNITLKQDVSGQLVCSVRNNVSSVSKKEKISTCGFIFINCTINMTHISQWVLEANNTLCIEPTTTTTTPTTVTTAGKDPGKVSIKSSTNITSSNQTPSRDVPWYINNLTIIAGVLSALVILLVAGVVVVCAHKKKENNKPKEEEDEQELTYADVRVMQRPGRQMQQKKRWRWSTAKSRFQSNLGRPLNQSR
ncbi:uncharacterized protein LOC119888613 [Micropterus salmoides]|uniref:uncharacterized protein LOC119888613 n=1 Tax=Micropterus salmoides TaxID=27706 RepID=UPI0018ED1958|nr:uncharacterized protein LOC119888613 [Micropterus salmoides]